MSGPNKQIFDRLGAGLPVMITGFRLHTKSAADAYFNRACFDAVVALVLAARPTKVTELLFPPTDFALCSRPSAGGATVPITPGMIQLQGFKDSTTIYHVEEQLPANQYDCLFTFLGAAGPPLSLTTVASGATTLTTTGTFTHAEGAVAFVYADDIEITEAGKRYRGGEALILGAPTSSTATPIRGITGSAYTTHAKVMIPTTMLRHVAVRNLIIENQTPGGVHVVGGLKFDLCDHPVVEDVEFRGFNNRMIQFQRVVFPEAIRPRFLDCSASFVTIVDGATR